jgi:hypothetical protein
MELKAFDDAAADEIARFPRTHHPLVRIDAGEGDHDISIIARRRR